MYKGYRKEWNKHLDFIVLDIIGLILSVILAQYIRYGNLSVLADDLYQIILILLVVSSVIVSGIRSGYKDILRRGYWIELKEVFVHVSLVIGISMMLIFAAKLSEWTSRIVIFLTYALGIVICYLFRILWKKYVIFYLGHKRRDRRVLLVCTEAMAVTTLRKLRKNSFDFDIAGIVFSDQKGKGRAIKGIQVVCDLKELPEYLINNVIDEIFFQTNGYEEGMENLIMECQEMGITTHMSLIISDKQTETAYIDTFGGFDVITTSIKVASPIQLAIKRLMDLAGGLVGCMLTGLLCLYVVPKIKKADPGPAFFTQTRIGKHGRKFKIYKFRSMYMDAEARKAELMAQNQMSGIMFKMDNDPRILPGIGDFIRKTSIDEFPQFFNVLKGEMSLVGTRPPLQSEVDLYDRKHLQRLAVKPGITGLWQSSGRSDITDFEEVVRLDSKYIREWNIGLDIRILLKTVLVVLKHEGAK